MPDAISLSPEALELKRRGRRRLLGAVTIALVLVVFVPMILDSEPKKAGKDIALTIPAKEGQPALPPPGAAPAKPDAKPGTDMAPVEQKQAADSTQSSPAIPAVPAARPEAKSETQPPVKSDPPPVATLPAKTEAKPEPKAAEVKTAETKPAVKAVEAQPAAAKPVELKPAAKAEAKGPSKPEPKKLEGFVVQLGAFSDADKVKQLVARLKAAKIPVYTEQIKGDAGNLTRVRAGPYKTREAAEKAVPQVKKAGGENGKVVPL